MSNLWIRYGLNQGLNVNVFKFAVCINLSSYGVCLSLLICSTIFSGYLKNLFPNLSDNTLPYLLAASSGFFPKALL